MSDISRPPWNERSADVSATMVCAAMKEHLSVGSSCMSALLGSSLKVKTNNGCERLEAICIWSCHEAMEGVHEYMFMYVIVSVGKHMFH